MDFEMSKPENHENLFFHQQRNPVRQYKRVRKEPEELPQALRYFKYANLNPRIAAFLGKQDPKNLLKRAKGQGGKPDGKESAAVAPPGGHVVMGGEFGSDFREARNLLPDISAGFGQMTAFGSDGFGQSRLSMYNENEDPQRYQFEETTFAAPNILRELADTLQRYISLFREYAQRTTFYDPETGDPLATDATTPAVLLPTGIKELVCQSWEDVTSEVVYVPRTWQSLQAGLKYGMSLTSGKPDVASSVGGFPSKPPEGTADKKGAGAGGLKSIVDLLEEVRMKSSSKRDGDNAGTKVLHDYKKKGKAIPKDASSTFTPASRRGSKERDRRGSNGRERRGSRDKERRGSKDKDRRGSKEEENVYVTTVGELFEMDDATGKIIGVDYNTLFEEKDTLPRIPRKNKPTFYVPLLEKDKVENYLPYRVKAKPVDIRRVSLNVNESISKKIDHLGLTKPTNWHLKSVGSLHVDEAEKEKIQHRYGTAPTINFNLTSRKAIDEGWILNVQPEPNMNENNLLEWASSKLQLAMKQKEEEDEEARKMGCDKPMQIRYYGDSRRDTLLKLYRKGNDADGKGSVLTAGLLLGNRKSGAVPRIPQLHKLDSSQRDRFTVQLPDGSTSVYYPKGGELAIMASAVPNAPGQLYVHCYANNPERTCLATFTPYGRSCCYHKNGVPGLVLSEKGGLLKSEDGSVLRKWVWPSDGSKIKDPVTFTLNKEMFVRVLNQSNVVLNYNSNRESIKLQVGAVRGVLAPPGFTSSQSITLQSNYSLNLRTAADFGHANRAAEKPKVHVKPRKGPPYFRKIVQPKKSSDLEMLKHSLDPPERFEFESQADRELLRLQDKSKYLLENWMEHYRVLLGVTSPALKRLFDKPEARPLHRRVQSAKEPRITYLDEEEFEDKVKFQSFRSPSAPPRHMVPGPNSLTVKDTRPRPAISSSTGIGEKKLSEAATVRIASPKATEHHDAEKDLSGAIPSTVPTHPHQTSHSGSRQRPSTHGARSTFHMRASSTRTSNSALACASSHSQHRERTLSFPECDGCPVATRHKLLHVTDKMEPEKLFFCKCSKHRIPLVFDLEFDYFLHMVAPVTQLIVIFVVNSLYPNKNPSDKMLDDMYIAKNKNRTQPCRQSRHDQYRVLRYDIAVAKSKTNRSTPLLFGRHNAVPGMALMYCGGRLVFADHIFNGYGNARNDFRKQVIKSHQEYLSGHFLPDDFRFTPGRGKSGFRAAWGGEIGGAGIDGKGQPGMFFSSNNRLPESERNATSAGKQTITSSMLYKSNSESDLTSSSSLIQSAGIPAHRSFDTARDFVQYSLSANMYMQPKSRRSSKTLLRSSRGLRRGTKINSSFLPPSPQSTLATDNAIRADQLNGFMRMQTVK